MRSISYKLSYIVLLFSMSLDSYAQSDLDNHKKYWYYRTKLLNDFIKVGNSPVGTNGIGAGNGESIPLGERHGAGDPWYIGSRHLNGGDLTTRMGIYLSVLATEYRLLKNANQNVDWIKHEIFCALNAINRIDYVAETAWPVNPSSPNLNGFFIRGDVPERFILDNYKHFNYFNHGLNPDGTPTDRLHDRGFTQDTAFKCGVDSTENRYPFQGVAEESQDQVYYLLMGLTLTAKLVDTPETDGTNTFGYGSGETQLAIEAKNIAHRLITYIKSNPAWIILNPNTASPISQLANNSLPLPPSVMNAVNTFLTNAGIANSAVSGLGPIATPYSYALDNLGGFIKNDNRLPRLYDPFITPGFGIDPMPFNPTTDYRNLCSSAITAGPFFWQGICQVSGGPSVDEQGFFHILAGLGNNVYNTTPMLNLDIQGKIDAIQNQINKLNNAKHNPIAANNAMNNLLGSTFLAAGLSTVLNKLVDMAGTILNTLLNAVSVIQSAIQYLQGLLGALINSLTPIVKMNTTDLELVNNTYNNQMIISDCSNNPVLKYGSKLYFGTYLREILHGNEPSNVPGFLAWIGSIPPAGHNVIKSDVQSMLASAPCQGNYNHFNLVMANPPYQNVPPDPWGVSCFVDRPDRKYKKASCPFNTGDYAGLDYMLMHNLYYLVEGSTEPIVDMRDRIFTTNLPINNTFLASNPGSVGAFEYLKINNSVAGNGGVEFRAGKEIKALPGFQAAPGAAVGMRIDPYTCSAMDPDIAMRSSNPNPGFTKNDSLEYTESILVPQRGSTYVVDKKKEMSLAHQQDSINRYNKSLMPKQPVSKIKIYPNPSSGNFNIELDLETSDNVAITVLNNLGQIVFSENHVVGTMNLPVSLSNYPKGIYIVKVKFSNQGEEVSKITIQ